MSLLLDALKQAEENKKKVNEPVTSVSREQADSGLSLEGSEALEPVVELAVEEPMEPTVEPVVEVAEPEVRQKEVNESEPVIVANEPSRKATPPPVDMFSIGKKQEKKPPYKNIGIAAILLLAVGVASLFLLDQSASEGVSHKERVAVQRQEQAQKEALVAENKTDIPVETVNLDMPVEKFQQEPSLNEVEIAEVEVMQAPIENPSAIQIKKRRTSSGVLNKLQEAYGALVGGDLQRSQTLYAQVLKQQPRQIDAMLGLANIESQRGHLQSARTIYERVLRLDGTNSIAQIGMLQTYGQQDAVTRQQVLEELISKYSSNPEVHLALGHALSEQSKWTAAQISYFKAFSLNSSNAVYAYNLAVSLDSLEKYAVAKTYYKKALALNEQAAKPLNLERVKNRLMELSGSYE